MEFFSSKVLSHPRSAIISTKITFNLEPKLKNSTKHQRQQHNILKPTVVFQERFCIRKKQKKGEFFSVYFHLALALCYTARHRSTSNVWTHKKMQKSAQCLWEFLIHTPLILQRHENLCKKKKEKKMFFIQFIWPPFSFFLFFSLSNCLLPSFIAVLYVDCRCWLLANVADCCINFHFVSFRLPSLCPHLFSLLAYICYSFRSFFGIRLYICTALVSLGQYFVKLNCVKFVRVDFRF